MKKAQLLVKIEEGGTSISLFAADAATSDRAIKLGEFDLRELQKLSADIAEATIGAAVLGALDRMSETGLGLRDYQEGTKEVERRFTDMLRERADRDDPGAQFHLALSYIAQSVELEDVRHLELAEELLKKSAAAGHSEARSFLIGWPETKARRTKMIEQKRGRGR